MSEFDEELDGLMSRFLPNSSEEVKSTLGSRRPKNKGRGKGSSDSPLDQEQILRLLVVIMLQGVQPSLDGHPVFLIFQVHGGDNHQNPCLQWL